MVDDHKSRVVAAPTASADTEQQQQQRGQDKHAVIPLEHSIITAVKLSAGSASCHAVDSAQDSSLPLIMSSGASEAD